MPGLNCQGKLLDLTSPVVMGILNATPDSFFDGGNYQSVDKAIKKAEQILNEGARIIDIGGMSSRPGAEIISVDEEIKRVVPVVSEIRRIFPNVFLSVDTFRQDVAKAAFEHGIDIINDISAGELDPGLMKFAGEKKVPYIIMHMKGVPENMQENPQYENVLAQVLQYLAKRITVLEGHGIGDIVVDPGFGFGKTLAHNYSILNELEVFDILDRPLLVGISRKSMIYNAIGGTPDSALYGTSAAHIVALMKHTKILRVHDVKAAQDTIKIWEHLNNIK